MLTRSGATFSRPDGLDHQYGLLEDGYHLSEVQAQAILELRLHRLTGLEQDKLRKEYEEILGRIKDLLDILQSTERLLNVIREELLEIRNKYGDGRRTQITQDQVDLSTEDLIAEEDVVVTLSHAGYAKSQPLSDYRAQRRGGRGKTATRTKDEDFVERMFVANTHDMILCFSNRGKVYWLKVYQLPQAGRTARGRPLVNLLPLQEGEKITAVLPVQGFEQDKFIFMATTDGTVKKTPLEEFSRPRSSGIIAIDLRANTHLVGVALTDGYQDIFLLTDAGKVIRFVESDVRAMGRTARGVKGIVLKSSQRVISLIIANTKANAQDSILTSTENGYGKRTTISDYPVQGRGGQGVISIQVNERNGLVVGAELTHEDDEVMLITNVGILIRTRVVEVSMQGRNTQGVRLIDLQSHERLVSLEKVVETNGQPVEGKS
jgi:DNA gyrase subunit A